MKPKLIPIVRLFYTLQMYNQLNTIAAETVYQWSPCVRFIVYHNAVVAAVSTLTECTCVCVCVCVRACVCVRVRVRVRVRARARACCACVYRRTRLYIFPPYLSVRYIYIYNHTYIFEQKHKYDLPRAAANWTPTRQHQG